MRVLSKEAKDVGHAGDGLIDFHVASRHVGADFQKVLRGAVSCQPGAHACREREVLLVDELGMRRETLANTSTAG